MINLLPQESETLIVAHECNAVLERLTKATAPEVIGPGNTPAALMGWIKERRFQLMIRQRRPNGFMPIVEGRVDSTSTGCLIFLEYKFTPVTRMFLVFWSIIVFVAGIFLSVYNNDFLIWLTSIAILCLMHGIAWANFKLHYKTLREIVFKLMG